MLDPSRIHCRDIKRLVEKGEASGIRPDWLPKVKRLLSALNVAVSPEELNLPSYAWHKLKGNRSDTYSVLVSRNWRITFKWDENGPFDVNLEDYHGK